MYDIMISHLVHMYVDDLLVFRAAVPPLQEPLHVCKHTKSTCVLRGLRESVFEHDSGTCKQV